MHRLVKEQLCTLHLFIVTFKCLKFDIIYSIEAVMSKPGNFGKSLYDNVLLTAIIIIHGNLGTLGLLSLYV